jgi:hypothetical protein
MKAAIARIVGCMSFAYLAAWAIGFAVLVGDVALVAKYLVWSWGGGERATYVQIFALIGGSFGALFGLLWHLYSAKRE